MNRPIRIGAVARVAMGPSDVATRFRHANPIDLWLARFLINGYDRTKVVQSLSKLIIFGQWTMKQFDFLKRKFWRDYLKKKELWEEGYLSYWKVLDK